jgi:RNA polymerase sigma factor (sigma-70 family)
MGDELREQCRQGVRRVLAQRGWTLVQDEAVFVEEVLAEVQARLPYARRTLEKIIEDATVNRYCHLWYATCRVGETVRQHQAFTELHRYLYCIALYCAGHDPYIAEESTQEALINVWQHLGQVRDPGSFASWARMIVLREVRARFRKRGRKVEEMGNEETTWQVKETSEADLRVRGETEDADREAWEADRQPGRSTRQEPKMTDEVRARIEAAIESCLRSEQQQAVIVGLFLDEKSVKEMADELATTPQNVYVLKARALQRLRECEEFLEALEELM